MVERLVESIKALEYYPPGYESGRERIGAGLLLGLPILFSLHFFAMLYEEAESLYYVDRLLGKTVRVGLEADSFLQLARGYCNAFLPFFLFLVIMMLYHYSYYYRDTRSIYLMKRLPERHVLLKSCVQAPLLGMAAGVVALAILCLLYFGAYLLFIPGECHPRFL